MVGGEKTLHIDRFTQYSIVFLPGECFCWRTPDLTINGSRGSNGQNSMPYLFSQGQVPVRVILWSHKFNRINKELQKQNKQEAMKQSTEIYCTIMSWSSWDQIQWNLCSEMLRLHYCAQPLLNKAIFLAIQSTLFMAIRSSVLACYLAVNQRWKKRRRGTRNQVMQCGCVINQHVQIVLTQ